MALLYSACHADLRVPLRQGPRVRDDPADDRRPADRVLDLRARPSSASSTRGGALQGLGLLHHRLRQEEGAARTLVVGGRLRRQVRLELEERVEGLLPSKDSKTTRPHSSSSSPTSAVLQLSTASALARPRTRTGSRRHAAAGLEHLGLARVPVAMSANRAISAGPFRSVLNAWGACQPTSGRRTNELGGLAARPSRQHLLLARGAVEVVLGRGARVLAHPRAAERLRPSSSFSPLRRRNPSRSCRTAARRSASCCHRDAAERVDQLREVLEVDLDQVVDLSRCR